MGVKGKMKWSHRRSKGRRPAAGMRAKSERNQSWRGDRSPNWGSPVRNWTSWSGAAHISRGWGAAKEVSHRVVGGVASRVIGPVYRVAVGLQPRDDPNASPLIFGGKCSWPLLIDRDKVFTGIGHFGHDRYQYSVSLYIWCNRQYFNVTSLW